MARGVPMAIFRPIPGQEDRNCDYLQESGAAVRVHDIEELRLRLMRFLAHPDLLSGMRAKAGAIGRPRSAYDVANLVMGHG
jgi:processive 1,2-diacylglycerol beta-glucosyltransferase